MEPTGDLTHAVNEVLVNKLAQHALYDVMAAGYAWRCECTCGLVMYTRDLLANPHELWARHALKELRG